jgi:hypothetical protein
MTRKLNFQLVPGRKVTDATSGMENLNTIRGSNGEIIT